MNVSGTVNKIKKSAKLTFIKKKQNKNMKY